MRSYKITISTLVRYLIFLYIFILVTSVSTGTIQVKIIRVLLAVGILTYILTRKGFKPTFYISWAIVFALYNVIMIEFSPYKSYAIEDTISLLYILVITMGICFYIKRFNIVEGMMKAMIIGTIVEAIVTFARFGALVFLTARYTAEGSANTLGFYAAMSFIMSLILVARSKKGSNKHYLYLATAVACLCITLLSGSRKAIVYIVVPIVVYWILRSKNPIKTFKNTIIAIAMVILTYYAIMHIPFMYNMLGRRVESMIAGFLGLETDASTKTRLRLIEAGLTWFRERPWTGYGLGGYNALNWIFRKSVYYAHNNYIELLVDCGLIGTIIYYWLYFKIIIKTVKNKLMDRKTKGILLGIMACFIIGDYGMVSYSFAIYQLMLMVMYMIASGDCIFSSTEAQIRPIVKKPLTF